MVNEKKTLLRQSDEDGGQSPCPEASYCENGNGKASNGDKASNQQATGDEEFNTYHPYNTPHSSKDDEDVDDPGHEGEETGEMHEGLQRLVMVAAATAATLGYDVGIMAAAIQPMEATMDLNGFQKELAMGSLNFVAALGAVLGGKVANEHGRKYTVKLCCWIFVVGTLLMALAPDYYVLLLGRVVTGMGVGVSFVVAPVYLSEVAPTHLRGRLNTIFDVAINGGILLGYVLGFLVQLIPDLQEKYKWRVMLGLGIVLPIMVLWNLACLPESPRWLVMADRSDEAHAVMEALGTKRHHILGAVSSIEEELQQDEEYSTLAGGGTHTSRLTPIDAIRTLRFSSTMKLAIALGFWQQITGTEAVLYYSADFLENAGLESPTQRLLGNCFVGLCKLTPELIAMQLVDKWGRRPLMISSAVSLMLTTFLLSAAFFLDWHPMLVVILLCAVMASFSIGLGPFTFLIASENLGLSERATGMTLCAAVNRCTSGTVALTAVTMYEGLGSGGLFVIYGLIGACSLPYYFTSIPETAGQSLEQLAARNREVELQKGISTRSDVSAMSSPPAEPPGGEYA